MGAQATQLSYAQPLFLEEQRASDVLQDFSFVMWSIAVAMLFVVLVVIVVLRHRIPAPLVGVLMGACVLVVGVILLINRINGITVIEPGDLQIRLSLLGMTVWKRTIPVSEIQSAELSTSSGGPMVLQWMQGDVGFMTRKQCVRIRLGKFRNFLIGSQRPQKLLDAVRTTMSTPTTTPNMNRSRRDDA